MSVIRPYGYSESKCGYCKGSRSNLLPAHVSTITQPQPSSSKSSSLSSKSYSVLADSISPTLYEGLIHRGWRRSGVHLYKPQNFSSCCPTLTTRLLTKEFAPTKSQRKVLKKMKTILRPPPQEQKILVATTPTPMSTSLASSTSKKQKRNHLEKGKKHNRKSTTTLPSPLKQETSSHPDLGTANISS